MGFMGLKHYLSSDTASDFAFNLRTAIDKALFKEINKTGNDYNTSGITNIMLVLREYPDLFKLLTPSMRQDIKAMTEQHLKEYEGTELEKDAKKLAKQTLYNLKFRLDN